MCRGTYMPWQLMLRACHHFLLHEQQSLSAVNTYSLVFSHLVTTPKKEYKQNMGINSGLAKVPYLALYSVLAVLVSFNWIRVILFQKDFEIFRTSQPWDYHLSNFFSASFGITHQQYFIFAFPVALASLYITPKLFGKLMRMDKKSNVKGDNHVVALLILLIAPSIIGLSITSGIILIVLFSLWSWKDERI